MHMKAFLSDCATTVPEKHANGIGHEEGVVNCSKKCLVIVLVWVKNSKKHRVVLRPIETETYCFVAVCVLVALDKRIKCLMYCLLCIVFLLGRHQKLTKGSPVTPGVIVGDIQVGGTDDIGTVSVQFALTMYKDI